MSKIDFKRKLQELYLPPQNEPSIVNVPTMHFVMIDGEGDPNSSEDFQAKVEILYAISYTIKMLPKKGVIPEGYFDYVIPPLEGLWDTVDGETFHESNKDNLKWTLMIMQPEFVTEALFAQVKEKIKQKKGNGLVDQARFEAMEEGLSAQILHVGPYEHEQETLDVLKKFIAESGYEPVKPGHHEIYLNDPRKCKPENLKTTLRIPIRKSKKSG